MKCGNVKMQRTQEIPSLRASTTWENDRLYAHVFLRRREADLWHKPFWSLAAPVALDV
jgi:hypothetical protein